MISVVIPAHNEATVIGRLLTALGPGIDDGRLEVIVVANGCTDDTAALAQTHPVAVIDRPESGKAGALNAGDAALTAFPRFYVDADIVLTADDLTALAGALGGPVLAVAPGRVTDASRSSRLVRSYMRIWDQLDSTVESLAGRGCYGVSATGRQRWADFPDLVADDGYVNALFGPAERTNVEVVTAVVTAPSDVGSLLDRKRRSHRGNVELDAVGMPVTSSTGWLSVLYRHPARLVDAPVYVMLTVLTRLLTRRDVRRGDRSWRADASSRPPT